MAFKHLLKKILKSVLDFLFGDTGEHRYNEKKGEWVFHRKYRFVPRLRAKPQQQKK